MHKPDISLNDDMEHITSVENETMQDSDFFTYDAQVDDIDGLREDLEQENNIEVEIPNETYDDVNEETE